MISLLSLFCTILMALQPAPATTTPHELNQAISQIEQGTVTFTYNTREGIEGNGHGVRISLGPNRTHCYFNGHWDADEDMVAGPARAMIKIDHGQITRLDVTVGPPTSTHSGTTDLGHIDSQLAGAFFLEQAIQLANDQSGEALLAGLIADKYDAAPPLLAILNNRHHDDELRQDALVFVATLASQKALASIKGIIKQNDESMELRESAVFALSQMDNIDNVPLLLGIARDTRTPQLQQAAFFALAEYDTPEVLQMFEDILLED